MIDSPYRLVFRRGIIYEGDLYQLWAIYPAPLVAPASCSVIEGRNLVFREDVFDPLTRIRRGRFYRCIGGRGGRTIQAKSVANGIYGDLVGITSDQFDEDDSGEVVTDTTDGANALNQIVTLGDGRHSTAWRIISVEQNVFGHAVFTLRAQSLFGVLPEIRDGVTDKDGKPLDSGKHEAVLTAMNKLVDTHHRLQPDDIADRAREAARVILNAWVGQESKSKDLGPIVSLIGNLPDNRFVLTNAANIVNLFHSRTKSAVREKHESANNTFREITEDDAQIDVDLVGLIVREIGWSN